MKSQGIECLQWPAQSPDLNPIENIWKLLKDNVRRRNPFPRTREELSAALAEEWDKLDPAFFVEVVRSMPRRIAEVIAIRLFVFADSKYILGLE
jgi:DDE superfamily endonuclease